MQTQTKIIDDEWYGPVKSIEEAKGRVDKMLARMEELEKQLNKPDYELAKKLAEIKVASDEDQGKLDDIIAEIKSRPISAKKEKAMALWVMPYKSGKATRREARMITRDLKRKKELQKHCDKGTVEKSEKGHVTQIPAHLIDEDKTNGKWRFKPTRLEVIEK